jgi:hypothetical protein
MGEKQLTRTVVFEHWYAKPVKQRTGTKFKAAKYCNN